MPMVSRLRLAVPCLLVVCQLVAGQPGPGIGPPGRPPNLPPGPRTPPVGLPSFTGRPTGPLPWLSWGPDPPATTTPADIVVPVPSQPTTIIGGGFTTVVPPPARTTSRPATLETDTQVPSSPSGDAALGGFTSGLGATTTDASPRRTSPTDPASSLPPQTNNMNGSSGAGAQPSRTLVIVLSTVLSAVGILTLGLSIWCCCRRRRPFFARGITPIDDEEIESWKHAGKASEKTIEDAQDVPADSSSYAVVRKPPSVIVYQNNNHSHYHAAGGRTSEDDFSPRSLGYKRSLEYSHSHFVPQTPVVAVAPNSRPGLTDETVQGDEAFIPSPKRQTSRLSKVPPTSPRHARTRSARSSISVSSWRDQWYSPSSSHGAGAGGDHVELSPRASNEQFHYPRSSHSERRSQPRQHHRIYSSSSNPPRLSLDDDFFVGGLSPRPLIRQSEIGRAIG